MEASSCPSCFYPQKLQTSKKHKLSFQPSDSARKSAAAAPPDGDLRREMELKDKTDKTTLHQEQ